MVTRKSRREIEKMRIAGGIAGNVIPDRVECHVNYLLEVKQGAQVQVRTQLLAHDAKTLADVLRMALAKRRARRRPA